MLELAREAAKRWPLKVQSITLAAHRENAVFRVGAESGAFALRLHREGYRTAQELNSELSLMAMLESKGVSVPRPVAGRDGGFLQVVDGVQTSVLSWLDGVPLGKTGAPLILTDRIGTFQVLGLTIAKMHDVFDAWRPPDEFTRPQWDLQGLVGETPTWGRFWENPALSDGQRQLFLTVRDRLRTLLADRRDDMGLIHADLVSENLLVDGARLSIIDFDDSGFGYRLQDLATALVKHQGEDDYPDLRDALLAGYRARATVSREDVSLFLLIRHLSYVGWIAPRMDSDYTRQRAAHFIAQAQERAEAFLAQA